MSKVDPRQSCLIVIFGATGDLMDRKLLPALYQLMNDRLLPARCHILGVGRDASLADEGFRKQAQVALIKALIAVQLETAAAILLGAIHSGIGAAD